MATHTIAITFLSGTIIYASSVNRNYADIASTINNLNSSNIITSGVDSVNINASAVTNDKLGQNAVDADKIDHEVQFYMEVFS